MLLLFLSLSLLSCFADALVCEKGFGTTKIALVVSGLHNFHKEKPVTCSSSYGAEPKCYRVEATASAWWGSVSGFGVGCYTESQCEQAKSECAQTVIKLLKREKPLVAMFITAKAVKSCNIECCDSNNCNKHKL